VRPVREQLEHDRVIRLLQTRFRRRYEVGINPGQEQNAPVGSGAAANYPDVVLLATDRGRRLQGVIEVETSESVNNLEAMAQWARLAKLRAPFHLYVPASAVDVARRLCSDHQIAVAEVVSYHSIGDQLRFTTVYRAPVETGHGAGRSTASRRMRAPHPKTTTRARGAKKSVRKPARTSRRK
jgi:hypothetical protein